MVLSGICTEQLAAFFSIKSVRLILNFFHYALFTLDYLVSEV